MKYPFFDDKIFVISIHDDSNIMNESMKVTLDAYQIVKEVKRGGNSKRVYVPIDWVCKRAKIVLMESLIEDKE